MNWDGAAMCARGDPQPHWKTFDSTQQKDAERSEAGGQWRLCVSPSASCAVTVTTPCCGTCRSNLLRSQQLLPVCCISNIHRTNFIAFPFRGTSWPAPPPLRSCPSPVGPVDSKLPSIQKCSLCRRWGGPFACSCFCMILVLCFLLGFSILQKPS